MSKTIEETISELHESLRDYIEATYHIGDAALINQRKALLAEEGVTFQVPYLESTPRYIPGARFEDIPQLHKAALRVYELLSQASDGLPKIIHNPPYSHQAEAISLSLIEKRNLVIMTGTGSGKTESFLLPILGKLAQEASDSASSFKQSAMRALLLYPMNALVNDQVGRLRAVFGDPRLNKQFKIWAGRPPRFARYTSRTPYAGVRTADKDRQKLESFEDFYVQIERNANDASSVLHEQARNLRSQLKQKGKWPAKANIAAWYGEKNSRWTNREGEFLRAITQTDDAELLTRYEVQVNTPDLLVTNYSMLEYMLMRPIERPIFDSTKEWLKKNPNENFVVVLDEAHLYRGAAGAEVGLLLRRLRDRLDIPVSRFQVICATASFSDAQYAPDFGSQLSGVPTATFRAIQGSLALKNSAAIGSASDADILAKVDLQKFYSPDENDRREAVKHFLQYRGYGGKTIERDLYEALAEFPPLVKLVNDTMQQAIPISLLGVQLFPNVDPIIANQAVTKLLAMGSAAREDVNGPGLIPCRIHNFFRGLPGLWVCMDPDCSTLREEEKSGICGRMYSQPHQRCGCGSAVLELHTCRYCGTAYARAYTDNIHNPGALWSEPGNWLKMPDGTIPPIVPLDLLLEQPSDNNDVAELADYDLETGRLNPNNLGSRSRTVYIRSDRVSAATDEDGEETEVAGDNTGQFTPCAVCKQTQGRQNRSTVQDHQTKGDQPFQALLSRQLQIQPPGPVPSKAFSPLRGRKVLAFSDSRQVAARLAPKLQMFSTRDSLRPLIIWGYRKLQSNSQMRPHLSLEDIFFAALLAAHQLSVRLRPELRQDEPFAAENIVAQGVLNGACASDAQLLGLWFEMRGQRSPVSLLDDLVKTISDNFLGLEALAVASIAERENLTPQLHALPPIPGIAESPDSKEALARTWIRCWRKTGFWLEHMPQDWWQRARQNGTSVKSHKGNFTAMDKILKSAANKRIFRERWVPDLLRLLCTPLGADLHRLQGANLALKLDGAWVRCNTCKSVHRPIPGFNECIDCNTSGVRPLDPDTDTVFLTRKGFYRNSIAAVLAEPPVAPMSLVAAEHTAQLNSAQSEDIFSKAEQHELLFQDIQLNWGVGNRSTAIDVLSSTTTMEVGIDIGALSGVALRNMPPGRASYQQRAGRAGRRGNAVATVVAFGSVDSHDEHYFQEPDEMIRGKVVDPRLTLDNLDIVRRHVHAFLLQSYHQAKLPNITPEQQPSLFSVLGTVQDFCKTTGVLNRDDFYRWLRGNAEVLRSRVSSWIPIELASDDRQALLDRLVEDCEESMNRALAGNISEAASQNSGENSLAEAGDQSEVGARSDNLLDWLLYKGVLPRYAFPTDVATFCVFDRDQSTKYRTVMRYAPSQGLPVALSQYAPGKQVWIAGKCYTSGAIYANNRDELFNAWERRRTYFECSDCGFARTFDRTSQSNDTQDCRACGGVATFGPGQPWLRPPGFAHPIDSEEVTSPDDMPETSHATRAKLTMETPSDEAAWEPITDQIRILTDRKNLLVSNTGPDQDGYTYCTKCGRIEAAEADNPIVGRMGPHMKPYPTDRDSQECPGDRTARHIVLGTDFITDIALFSLRVAAPLKLKPGLHPTAVALRTVSEALARAACDILELEPGELLAEFRPALNVAGNNGLEAEIFLYDTLPGGAGFASQLRYCGRELFERALSILKSCPEDCDASCYRCLRGFKNKFEHGMLDRQVGAMLVEYILTGEIPQFSAQRLQQSTDLLFEDLQRQDFSTWNIERNGTVVLPGLGNQTVPILISANGKQYAVGLSGPLTDSHPANESMQTIQLTPCEITTLLVNELTVRGNLPAATALVRTAIIGVAELGTEL